MVGRVVSAAPWAAIRALCRQHFRKPIHRSQAGEAPQILCGRRKEEFVLSSVWSSQTQTRQTKDSLEVRDSISTFFRRRQLAALAFVAAIDDPSRIRRSRAA